MNYVYSTLSASVRYCVYGKGGADLPRREKAILIEGGAGVATKHLVTPRGIATAVSDEDLAILKTIPLFQLHLKNGFLSIQEKEISVDKAVSTMQAKDKSSPKTPDDYDKDKAPKTGKNK